MHFQLANLHCFFLLFALFCTRQVLLNTVYLHLSAIYLDCLFNFTFFTSVCFRSEGFLSRFPPTCLSRFWWGICLSRYLCCALVLICIPSQYEYSKVRAMCGRGIVNTHPVWLWIPSSTPVWLKCIHKHMHYMFLSALHVSFLNSV